MRKDRPPRDPLEPIRSVVGWLLTLTVAALVLSVLIGRHQQLWGGGPLCMSQDPLDLPWKSASQVPPMPTIHGLARGVQATDFNVTFCANSPDLFLRLAGLISLWPTTILWLVLLLRLRGLLKAASQPGGLYSPVTAARLHALGWIMTVGAIVVAVLESAANRIIADRVIPFYSDIGLTFDHLTFPFSSFFLGLTLLTIARVMRLGAAMREELDVTV